jgi:hypothetical protein
MSVRSDRFVHSVGLIRSRDMMTRTSLLIVASIVMAIAGAPACGASVALENRPCPCTSGWRCCAERNVCVADGTSCAAAPVAGFSTSAVSSAQRVCAGSTTEGALEQATSAADATTKLAKGWIPCNRDRWLADRGGDGIVFSVDGTWSLLKLDGNGALTPLTVLGTHGTWALYGEGSSEPLHRTDPSAKKITHLGLVDDGAAPGGRAARIDFEPSSARMRLSRSQSSPPEQTWFAPIPGTPSCEGAVVSDVNVPACFCSAQCARLLSPACETETSASHCVAACQSATPAQRRGLTACASPKLPSSSCDPSCFLTIGWDPNRRSDGSSDGGTDSPAADGGN